MSLSVVPQTCYRVIDPRMDYTGEAYYAVPQGAKKVLFALQESQGSSASVQQFNFFTPNPETILSRRVLWRNTITLTLNSAIYVQSNLDFPTLAGVAYPGGGGAVASFDLGVANGIPIQLGLNDAPRPYGAHLFCQTMNANLNNNCQVTMNPSDIIDAMTHVNGRALYRSNDLTPWFPDPGPYESIDKDASRNPLGMSENWQWDYARGATPVKIVAVDYIPAVVPPDGGDNIPGVRTRVAASQIPVDVYIPANAADCGQSFSFSLAVQWESTEALMMSPFTWVCDGAGFRGLQSLNFNFSMLGTAAGRLWSHRSVYTILAHTPNNAAVEYTVGSICLNPILSVDAGNSIAGTGGGAGQQALFTAPTLLLEYLYPPLTVNVPRITTAPYRELTRYPMATFSFGTAATVTVNSAQLQLPLIPEMVIVYARRDNSIRESNTVYGIGGPAFAGNAANFARGSVWSCSAADIFLPITNINIQWNVATGLLSTAQPQHLYEMSKRNGVDLPYTAWTGSTQQASQVQVFTTAPGHTAPIIQPISPQQGLQRVVWRVPTTGSVLALRFGYEIPLDEGQAPGLRGTWNWMITTTFAANGEPASSYSIAPAPYMTPAGLTVGPSTGYVQAGTIPSYGGGTPVAGDLWTMYNVFVFPGTVTLQPMLTTKDIGVLTNSDIVSAGVKSNLPMSAIRPPMGGDFLGSMFEKLRDGMGNMGDLASAAVKRAMSMFGMSGGPNPGDTMREIINKSGLQPTTFDGKLNKLAASAAEFARRSKKLKGDGLSGGDMTGGDMTGGRMAPPSMLRSRLQQFMN